MSSRAFWAGSLLAMVFMATLSSEGTSEGIPVTKVSPAIPAKTVVLTFDDSVRSHLTVVAPLLKEYGFGATFFVTAAWMPDHENFLNWEEIAELHRMGFEIGNHSWIHCAFHESTARETLPGELARVEEALKTVGVPRPISFSWCGNHFGPEAIQVLQERGYVLARRGPQPDAPLSEVVGMGPLYDPRKHHPLLTPSSGLAVPEWTLADFKAIVDRAEAGKAVVFQFHGVPDGAHPPCSTPPERFRAFMAYLHENDYHVVAMRDLAKYATKIPDDPLTKTTFFR